MTSKFSENPTPADTPSDHEEGAEYHEEDQDPKDGHGNAEDEDAVEQIEEATGEEVQCESDGKEDEEANVGNFWDKYPFLSNSLNTLELPEKTKEFLRENLGKIEKSKLRVWEQKWERLMTAELELVVQRQELVTQHLDEKSKLNYVFEHKWERLTRSGLEWLVQRQKLVIEQVKLALDLM